jgi:tRNA(Ser,Leu) C12 N-acetylase TAN1
MELVFPVKNASPNKIRENFDALIKGSKIKKGDSIAVELDKKDDDNTALLFFALIAIGLVLASYFQNVNKKKNEETELLLRDIFNKYSTPEELERAIEVEYNVSISVKSEANKFDFSQLVGKVNFGTRKEIENDINKVKNQWIKDI